MHTNHLILVEAGDWKEAISLAEEHLEHYGDSKVWDWYEIGGRWNWSKNERDKKANTLCVGKDKKKAEKLIRQKLQYQQDYIDDYNKKLVEEMKKEHIVSLKDIKRNSAGMIGYYLHELGQLIGGYYCFNSHFFDANYGCAYIDEHRIKDISKDGDKFWICNFDLHN